MCVLDCAQHLNLAGMINQSDCKKTGHYELPCYNYYLLTEFAFRTVRYLDQGPEVRTELAMSVRKDRGLNILQY